MIDTNIINKADDIDSNKNKDLWIALGKWLGFEGPIKRKEVRRHVKNKWRKLEHALDLQMKKNTITTPNRITQKKKTQLIISARKDFNLLNELEGFRYVNNPECIVDTDGRTLVHLENIDQAAVIKATNAVNHYYFHTLEHPSHRSDGFWKNFIEHFGAYTMYNVLPYTSSNTASSHNIEHQVCVDNLLCDLIPLTNCINHVIQENYDNYYKKLIELKWGPFAPRSFGIFPMIAINYNSISDFHWDEHDEPNSLCCLVALGDFKGGELIFPQLQIIVPLRPGQVVVFPSRLLLHGNLKVTRGIRHSIVYFIHSTFFRNLRDFREIYNDHKEGIERNAHGLVVDKIPQQDLNDAQNLNKRIKLEKAKANQIHDSSKSDDLSRDARRKHIGK